jgi:hypothetical protein
VLKDVELTSKKSVNKLQTLHDDIERLLGGGKIERNDLNNLLLNCTNSNPTLTKLRDFVYLRNLKLVEKAVKDDKYRDFVGRVKNVKAEATSKEIDAAFFKLISPYFEYWDGLWRFMEFSSGRVRKVDVIDPTDIQKLYSYLD